MRRAELVTAAVMAAFSIYVMWKSTELPIGWIPEEGPGGGAFPFWLSLGMLVASVLIFARTWRGLTPESQSTAPFIPPSIRPLIYSVVIALTAMIAGIHVVGVYFSVPVFLAYYMRVLGGHGWRITAAVSLSVPVVTFLFFEKALLIILPKGITDELFYIFF